MAFIYFVSFIIIIRMAELTYSRSNEKWLLQHGAVEYGQKQYPFMIALHTLFIISLIVEYSIQKTHTFSFILLFAYCLLLVCKGWVISTLGKFWNTKIYHITGFPLVKKGIYKYVKHPNYIIVIIEIALIPLIFNLYFTAVVFTFLNSIILYIRIKEENNVLDN